MEVLDGKKLVMPLRLTPEQAESFTTCQPHRLTIADGERNLLGLVLPVQAFVFEFPYNRFIVGMN